MFHAFQLRARVSALLAVIFLCLLASPVLRAEVATVKGIVAASFGDKAEPLAEANILLFTVGDSTAVRSVASDTRGAFALTYNRDAQKVYRVRVSFTGMQPVFCDVKPATVVDLGQIVLNSSIELGEVTVEAPVKDIELVGDTTVINVNAFKTSQGALLEELIALIPGMEYDSEAGTLTYNDEPLTEININGQTFDLGDVPTVLETIPVEILSNLKVYDKTSEMERFSGRRSRRGRKNMVLDLTTREEFGSMLVAKARAAQGTERKHEYAADVNHFKKQGDNINLLAQTGNLRSRSAYPDARTDRLNAGFNVLLKDKIRVNARVGYNHNIDGSQSSSGNEQFLVSGTRWRYTKSENTSKSHGFDASAGFSGEIANSIFLQFMSSYRKSDSGSGSGSRQASFNGDPELDFRDPFGSDRYDEIDKSIRLNEIKQQSVSDNDTQTASASASIMKMFNDKRTGVTFSAGYNYNDRVSESFSLSRTTYYELRDIFGNDSVLLRNQYRRSPTRTNSYNVSAAVSQRFSEAINLDFTYTLNSSRGRSYRDTYDLSPFFSPDMEEPATWLPDGFEAGYTDSLSNRSLNNTLKHDFRLTFNYFTEAVSLLANFSVSPERSTLDQKTGKMYADTVRNSVNFAPDLTFSLRPGKSQIDIKYRGETQQPSLSDLLTVTDNSDPLNISRGNPDLSPAYQQDIEVSFDNRDIGLNFSSRWSNTYNSVTQSTTYDLTTGGVETHPVNITGNWNLRNSLRYTLRLQRVFRITSSNGVNFSRNVGLLNENRQPEPSRSVTDSRNLSSQLRLTYSPSWGQMDVSGSWRHSFSKNLLRETRNYVRSYNFGYNIFANIPGNVQLKSDISFSFRNGTNINRGEDDQLLWNLEASWCFLKRNAEIKIEWRDILSNSKDFRRNVSATSVSETYSRVIGSYFLATFRYTFNRFNGKGEMPRFMRDRGDRGDRGDRRDRGGDWGGGSRSSGGGRGRR